MTPCTFPLWENDMPCYQPQDNVPTLTYYPAADKKHDGTFIIFPGGGYHHLAVDHEGDKYAKFLNDNGYDAFVVTYRIAPAHFPAPLLDARHALRTVRRNSAKYGINPQKIAVMGSSAGAHLATLLATFRGDLTGENDVAEPLDYLPNATVLCYPVISGTDAAIRHLSSFHFLMGTKEETGFAAVSPDLIADEHTPPAFLWHTAGDELVNVINSYRYAARLRELNIPVEMHIFPYGKHGLGLCNEEGLLVPHAAIWAELLLRWLDLMDW